MPTLFHRSPRPGPLDPTAHSKQPKDKSKSFGFRRSSAPAPSSSSSRKHPATRKGTKDWKKMQAQTMMNADLYAQQQFYCSPTTSDGFVHLQVSLTGSPGELAAPVRSTYQPPPPLPLPRHSTIRQSRSFRVNLLRGIGPNGEIPTLASAIRLDQPAAIASGYAAVPMMRSETFGPTSSLSSRRGSPPVEAYTEDSTILVAQTSRMPTPMLVPVPPNSSSSMDTLPSSESSLSVAIAPAELSRPASRASRAASLRRSAVKAIGRKISMDRILHVIRRRPSQMVHEVRASEEESEGGEKRGKLDSRRWSSAAVPPPSPSPTPASGVEAKVPQRNSLALPGIRTLRNKFSVRQSLVASPVAVAVAAEGVQGVDQGEIRWKGMKAAIGLGPPPSGHKSPLPLEEKGRRASRRIEARKKAVLSFLDLNQADFHAAEQKAVGPVGMAGVLHKLVNEPTRENRERGEENEERRLPPLPARHTSFAHHPVPSANASFVPRLIPLDPPSPRSAPQTLSASSSLEAQSHTPQAPSSGLAPTPVNSRFVFPAVPDISPLDPHQPLGDSSASSALPSSCPSPAAAITSSSSSLTSSSGETGVEEKGKQGMAEMRSAVARMRDLTFGRSVSSNLASTASRTGSISKLSSRPSSCHLTTGEGLPDRPSASSIHSSLRHSIDGLPIARGVAFPTSMKPSRSKSTTALPALLSAFDLVESTQREQGNGWWSRLPPPPPRPSLMPLPHPTGRRPTLDEAMSADDNDEEANGAALMARLAELEQIASRAATAPRRVARPVHLVVSPRIGSPRSPRLTSARSTMTPPRGAQAPLGSPRTPWRAGSGLPRSRSRSYVAPVPQRTFASPVKSHLLRSHFSTTPETPCRGSRLPPCPGSPLVPSTGAAGIDAGRRVSFHVQDATLSSRGPVRPGTPKSRLVAQDSPASSLRPTRVVGDWGERVEELKAKHALETDALLFALGGAKQGEDRLRKEVEGLHRLLAEGWAEREALRTRVSRLEHRLGREADERYGERRGHRKNKSAGLAGLAIRGADLGPSPVVSPRV